MTEISASARDAHEVKQEAAEVQESKTVKINDEKHARGTADTVKKNDESEAAELTDPGSRARPNLAKLRPRAPQSLEPDGPARRATLNRASLLPLPPPQANRNPRPRPRDLVGAGDLALS